MSTTIFIFNGPNLNLLGTREPDIYGTTTLAEIDAACVAKAREHGLSVDFRQSNHEGVLVDWMHQAHKAKARAIIINAAAYTHTSIALLDAAKAVTPPVIEVHLSDPQTREEFRHKSYIGEAAVACCKGKGLQSYLDANDLEADWKSVRAASNEALVNTLAMMSPYGPAEKQALLEAPDLASRAATLVAITEMELARQAGGDKPILN